MPNIDKVLEVAQRVHSIRAQLKDAEAELASLVSAKPAAAPARRKPVRGASPGPSVSQRVINMVLDAGPVGVARRDLVAVLGKDADAAIHSALKAHQAAGRIKNDAGQWVATSAYVQALQAPESTTRETRPMRAQAPADAYLGAQ
jgi:hypothetical protein